MSSGVNGQQALSTTRAGLDESRQAMGKSNPVPDYKGAAEAQAQSGTNNINSQTAANRPNQSNPFSSQQWTKDAQGNWTQSTQLNGGLGQANSNLQNQWAQQSAQPFDNGTDARNQAITGAYNQATSRLDPRFAQQDQLQSSQLANQGLDPNSQAYRNSMQQYGQQKNDAYSSAMNGAIAQGTAAQQATFGENMQARMAPMEQLQGLNGLTSQQGFNAAGVAGPTQYLPASIAHGEYVQEDAKMAQQQWKDYFDGLMKEGSMATKAMGSM